MPETTAKPWGETKFVGKPIPRVDGYERVSGTAEYPSDVVLPNMLHAAILRCPHGQAQVKRVDLAKAREMPGVRAVLSDADKEAQIPWYAPPGSPGSTGSPTASRLFDPHCRFEGEEIAAVAAETPQQAWDAVRAIRAEYKVLPSVVDMEEALKPGAPAVQESGNRWGAPRETKRGDVAQGFAEADVVLEETYRTSCEIHTPSEIHGSVVRWDGDHLTVWDRPAHIMKLKAGVKKDGTLTALQLTGLGEVGAYPAGTSVGYQVGDLYRCPNVLISESQAFINAGPNRAFRAPGFPQCSWALEQMMDALAEKIGMDPVEFRIKNYSAVCQMQQNKPYTSAGLRECLTEGARAFNWKDARLRSKGSGPWVRGVGVAAGMWGSQSGPPSTVRVSLYPDGSASLNMGAADLGTGTKTVMALVVAEELGVPLDRIQIENADTGTTEFTRPSGGSKTVFADSPAVRSAALEVKARVLEMAAAQLKLPVTDLAFQEGAIVAQGG